MTRVLTGPHSSGYYVDLELLGARAETGPWLYHGCVVCAKWANGQRWCLVDMVPKDVGPLLDLHLASAT